MKKFIMLVLLSFMSHAYLFGQCNNYFNFKEGTVFEVESFSAKDKKEGRMLNNVSAYKANENGFEATIHSTIYDKKDEEVYNGEYSISCENGVILMDMSKFIPQESLAQMKDAQIEISGDYLEMPSNLAVGQTLKDGNMKISMTGDQPMGMNMSISIVDRKVEARENVNTPAGKFDCFKITYTIKSTTNMMGININNTMSSSEWLAENVGVVKTESYNKKGNLTGYTLLSRFEN